MSTFLVFSQSSYCYLLTAFFFFLPIWCLLPMFLWVRAWWSQLCWLTAQTNSDRRGHPGIYNEMMILILTLNVMVDPFCRWSWWSLIKKTWFKIIFVDMSIFMVSIWPVDGLASSDTKANTGKVMTKSPSLYVEDCHKRFCYIEKKLEHRERWFIAKEARHYILSLQRIHNTPK